MSDRRKAAGARIEETMDNRFAVKKWNQGFDMLGSAPTGPVLGGPFGAHRTIDSAGASKAARSPSFLGQEEF